MVHLAVLRQKPVVNTTHTRTYTAITLTGTSFIVMGQCCVSRSESTVPTPIHRNGDEDLKMMGAQSEDPLAPQYEDPDTLSRKPPPAVTYKKAEEAVDAQPNPSVSGSGVGGRCVSVACTVLCCGL